MHLLKSIAELLVTRLLLAIYSIWPTTRTHRFLNASPVSRKCDTAAIGVICQLSTKRQFLFFAARLPRHECAYSRGVIMLVTELAPSLEEE